MLKQKWVKVMFGDVHITDNSLKNSFLLILTFEFKPTLSFAYNHLKYSCMMKMFSPHFLRLHFGSTCYQWIFHQNILTFKIVSNLY